MDTLTFDAALRCEVATLQAQHPILADAIGRAHALLIDGHVYPHDDGHSATVGSSKDPAISYAVNGSCTCPASQFHESPCKHRLALRLYQRVCDRLTAEEERYTVDLAPETLPQAACEVPAIMSTTVVIEGRQVEVKLCDTDDARLVARLAALLQQFPVPQAAPGVQAEGWCLTHGVQMKWNTGKEGKPGWWSHKTPDGHWCKGTKGGSRG